MQNNINHLKAFYPIVTGENNEILRKICDKVDIFDADIQIFCENLIDLMYAYDGVGLAAPQIGQNIRIIAITLWKEEKKGKKMDKYIYDEMAMVNPTILEHSNDVIKGEEGCLSIPGLFGDVERFKRIVVRYQDKKGKQHTQKFSGFSAVVIQHEMDHLDGILFTDKVIGKLKTREEDEKSK